MSSPKNSLRLRLKIREEILPKLEVRVKDIIDLFLSYELDYYSTLQILSTKQYLILCRNAIALPVTSPNHIAYINYSLLSLSLETPVTYQEYTNSITALKNLDRSGVPQYLVYEIDSLLLLHQLDTIQENNEEVSITNQNEEEINKLEFFENPKIDMSSLFEAEPKNFSLANAAFHLETNLRNNSDPELLIQNLSEATFAFTNFSCLLNYFAVKTDIYPKLTAYLLAIAYKTNEDSSNGFQMQMFNRTFQTTKANSYLQDAFISVVSNYIDYAHSIPEIQDFFNTVLFKMLDTCAEITNDPIYYVLASLQSNTDNESIVRYINAMTYIYSTQKQFEPSFLALGIELFISPKINKKGYAAAILQMVNDEYESILQLVKTGGNGPILLDDIMDAMPYFFDFDLLSLLLTDIKQSKEIVYAYLAKSVELKDKITNFPDMCIMKLLNTLNKEYGISQLDVFKVITK